MAVAPRRGHLIVRAGSNDDYVLQALDHEMLVHGKRGGRRLYAHAFVPFEPKPEINDSGIHAPHLAISLRRGESVRGLVVGPDGQPIPTVWMISRIHLDPRAPTFPGWSADHHAIARNGRSLLHGLDPDAEIPVTFLEPTSKLGLTARIYSA